MNKIIKKQKGSFTTVSNDILRDKRLTWSEMGMAIFLLSCSDDFHVTLRGLAECSDAGIDATKRTLNKLIEHGYVAREQSREQGQFGNIDYVVRDSLDGVNVPCTESPCMGFPYTEEHVQRNNNIRNTNKERTKEDIYSAHARFQKPSIEDVRAYIMEQGYRVDADTFFDYYESKGWLVGKSPMKDWKAAIRNWNRNQKQKAPHEETAAKRMRRFVDVMQGKGMCNENRDRGTAESNSDVIDIFQ